MKLFVFPVGEMGMSNRPDEAASRRESRRPMPTESATVERAIERDGGESPQLQIDVDRLLEQLDLAAKAGQMTQMPVPSMDIEDVGPLIADRQVGAFLFDGGEPVSFDPRELAETVNEFQRYNVEHSDHGIPFVLGIDGIHGNATIDEATVFPHNCGLGATRNPELIRDASAAIGTSIDAIGVDWNFSPTTDVQRDPRWGRYYEGFSEDPYLTGDMARATVEGYRDSQVGACVKHFAGYSVPENGNDRSPANVSLRDLRTNVLPAYRRALAADPETVMVSSGSVNGVPAHASEWLLTTVLRERWGYDGMIVTDWKDLKRLKKFHDFVPTYREAVSRGINAGIDMYMSPDDPEAFVDTVVDLVESGDVPESRIDDAVRNVLQFKARLGLFRDPYVDEAAAAEATSAGTDLCERATEQSITLLKNERDALPLEDADTILLTGPASDDVKIQMGGWTIGWQTIGNDEGIAASPRATTLYEGLRDAVGDATSVRHEPTGFTFEMDENYDRYAFENEQTVRAAASDADAAVVALGEGPYAEYYGDRDALAFPDEQRRVVAALADAVDDTTPLVGVVVAGRPRGTPATFDRLDAVVMAYLPGTFGGTAVADVLVGRANPSGRLPFVWPTGVGTVPEYYNALPEIRDMSTPYDDDVFSRDPLYEFGHGLSYTEFAYGDLQVDPDAVATASDRDRVTVTATVENVGERAGAHVVEAYATNSYGSVMHPRRRLLGYERVELDAGESATVDVPVELQKLAVVPGDVPGVEEMVVESGEYAVAVGDRTATLRIEEPGPVSDSGPVGSLRTERD